MLLHQHTIERAVVVCKGGTIEVGDLFLERGNTEEVEDAEYCTLEEYERRYIRTVLEDSQWRISGPKGAAKILGLPESSLRYRMKKLGIKRS